MACLALSTPVIARGRVARQSRTASALSARPAAATLFASAARVSRRAALRPAAALSATASLNEIAEVAALGPEIAKIASVMFVITLVGLAVGFVLLRVEALTDEE